MEFAILFGFIVLVGILAAVLRGNYEKTLRALGQPFGLAYERLGAPVGVGHALRGYVDGRMFELLVVPEGRRANARILGEHWIIHLCGQVPGGLAAGMASWTQRVSNGMVQVQSGEPAFDRAVFLEARDPNAARLVLDGGPRSAALRDLAAMRAIMADNKVMFHKTGFNNNVAKLAERLERLRAIARTLDPVQPR